jgi:glycosyltransferase involved in cell wall biosynthesis
MPDQIFPMVSVICLSFKQENFVERCLRSVAGQTYSDFEIIFIDNNSPDNSFDKGVETLKKLGVKYYAHKTDKNYGIAGGFNYGVKNFAKNPDYGMVYGNGYTYFDDTKEIVLYYKNPSISGWILRELLQAPAINPQGILYRHDVLKKLNYWDENAKVEDRELFYRLAREYTIGYLHIPLTFYRAHRSNISSNIAYMREGNEYFFKKYEEEFPKEIKIARMKQERFFAYVMSTSTPTFKTFFKLILNYKFNWLYTKEVIRCFILVLKAKLK